MPKLQSGEGRMMIDSICLGTICQHVRHRDSHVTVANAAPTHCVGHQKSAAQQLYPKVLKVNKADSQKSDNLQKVTHNPSPANELVEPQSKKYKLKNVDGKEQLQLWTADATTTSHVLTFMDHMLECTVQTVDNQ